MNNYLIQVANILIGPAIWNGDVDDEDDDEDVYDDPALLDEDSYSDDDDDDVEPGVIDPYCVIQ